MHKITVSVVLTLHSLMAFPQATAIEDALQSFQYNEALLLLEEEPDTKENRLLRASSYEKLNRYASALTIYQVLMEEYPDDLALVVSAAECASQMGDSNLSLQYWCLSDSLSPGNLFLQTRKTMAYFRNNRWKETIEQANSVLMQDSIPLLLRMVGESYLQTSQGDSAIYCFAKAIEKNPADYLAVHKLGSIYLGATFYESAIDLTEEYLKTVNPNQISIGQLNGMAHYSAGNYPEATHRLKENTALGDSSYTTCYYLGMSLYAGRLYFEAIPWLEKAYDQQNNDVNLLYYFGTALSRTYDRKRAISVLSEGVDIIEELNAMMYDFDCSFADAHQRSQNYGKAIEYYQSAYKRNSEAHLQLYNIGYCYDAMGDKGNAIRYFERFLKTAPEKAEENDNTAAGEKYYRAAEFRLKMLQEDQFFQGIAPN